MDLMGRILIADDEEIFLHSMADLLRREGFECDCVSNADQAVARLREATYDLLICDIKMPGNPELELVHQLAALAPGLPAILVTGYPSLRSAIQSVQLPVVAYLIKPVDLPELLGLVRTHTQRSRAYRVVSGAHARLQDLSQELGQFEGLMRAPTGDASAVSMDMFLSLSLRNIVGSLSDVNRLVEAVLSVRPDQGSGPGLSLEYPQPARLMAALEETIEVIEKTKSAFKSKDLGELRKRLEGLVKDAKT